MPIKEKQEVSSMTKKTGKQKKILKPSVHKGLSKKETKSTGKKQIISKSKGQNIQIHIDLSKKRGVSKPRSEVISHKKDMQPIINIAPPSYGILQPQTNYDNSMFQALNKIMEQNKRFEEALKGEQKKENVFTGREEPVSAPSLADIINKNTPSTQTLQQEYGLQLESLPSEEKVPKSPLNLDKYINPFSQEEEEDEEDEDEEIMPLTLGRVVGGMERARKPESETKKINKMKIGELRQYGMEMYNISPTYVVYNKKGDAYDKYKKLNQLKAEINNARMEKLRIKNKSL